MALRRHLGTPGVVGGLWRDRWLKLQSKLLYLLVHGFYVNSFMRLGSKLILHLNLQLVCPVHSTYFLILPRELHRVPHAVALQVLRDL